MFQEGGRLRKIGADCFVGSGLKMFNAPPSLRKINSGAFSFCRNLQRVVLNEGLEIMGVDDEESSSGYGVFEFSGTKEIVLPSTLVKLGKNSFKKCHFLERIWVEQRCQINVSDYVESKVDVQVFRAGDKIPLGSVQNNVGNDE